MKYKKLGNSGLLVSEFCLGTMTFGWHAEEKTSNEIMDKFVEDGGNFLDTANVYNKGRSEEIIGKWLGHYGRENVVIATKVRFRTSGGANSVGLSRKHIMHSVDESLKRLGTDYIDLLQVHAWDPLTPIEETFGTLSSLVDEGKVRYVGISNFRAWQFQRTVDVCERRGWSVPVSIQPQYSILVRSTENEIIPMALANNVAVLPWSPLAGGVLTGKYEGGLLSAPKGTRIGDSRNKEFYSRYENERTARVLEVLSNVSRETGKTRGQISLNWLLSNRAVTSPIIGARSVGQLVENLGSIGWNLTDDQMRMINEASRLEVTYPYDQRAEDQQRSDRILE